MTTYSTSRFPSPTEKTPAAEKHPLCPKASTSFPECIRRHRSPNSEGFRSAVKPTRGGGNSAPPRYPLAEKIPRNEQNHVPVWSASFPGARPDEKNQPSAARIAVATSQAARLGDVEIGFVVTDTIGPAEEKTEKRHGKKHDAKSEYRFALGLARCWFGWSHSGESTLVSQRGARSNYFAARGRKSLFSCSADCS